MLIDLEAIGQIGHGGDFERLAVLMVPGSQSGAVTKVIKQGTTAL
jgi:hypothetical protein